jgi:hypothetical protein
MTMSSGSCRIYHDRKSQVPVWSDNLQPGELDLAATIALAHHANAQQRLGSTHYSPPRSQSAVKTPANGPDDVVPSSPVQNLPIPPRPRRNVGCPPVLSSPGAGGSQHRTTSDPPLTDVPATSEPLNKLLTIEIVPEQEEKISKMTMEYLRRCVSASVNEFAIGAIILSYRSCLY